ncbi:MAG: transglutaminase domain-containing protein [Candidatus Latescibacteria bacterium]|nr:transglutaminase domain-containing protein [Candidatus Latescibacterota bacterium]
MVKADAGGNLALLQEKFTKVFLMMRMTTFLSRWVGVLLLLFSLSGTVQAQDKSFDPEQQAELVQTIPEQYREETVAALKEARENWQELSKAIWENKALGYLQAACFLISTMSPLDRLWIKEQLLSEHIRYAYKARETVSYSVPDSLFFHYILAYRFANEDLTPWRRQLYLNFYPLIKEAASPSEAAVLVNKWVAEKIRRISPQSLTPNPLHILRRLEADEADISLFTAAVLRAVAIPSRIAYTYYLGQQKGGKVWVEIYDGEEWLPLYPGEPGSFGDFHKIEVIYPHNITKVYTGPYYKVLPPMLHAGPFIAGEDITENYPPTGRLRVWLTEQEKPKPDARVTVNVFNNGAWSPITGRKGRTDVKGLFETPLGDGQYLVIAGKRDCKIFLEKVTIQPNRVTECRFNFPVSRRFVREDELHLISLVPDEYKKRVISGLKTAGDNWIELAAMLRKVSPEQREAVAFLIANMPPVELAAIDSTVLLEHITYTYQARENMPWGFEVSDDLFLHFVLPYRVAREPVTGWRKTLFEELAPRVKNLKNISEAALELNKWVKEKTSWRTRRIAQVLLSQRGPLQILHSGWGNCEEQTILYVAAARAVGIPARQVFCWWNTREGYHAWTEIWDGTNWKYLGSGEPAEELDQAWFSQIVSWVPKVYAYSFAQTPLKTDMLGKQIVNLLDVTDHYTRPGKLAVKVVQQDGPAVAVPVHVLIYNLGAFRSVAQGLTDEAGQVDMSIGASKYIVSAGTPEQNTWKSVQVKPEETCELSLNISKHQDFGIFDLRLENTE